MASEIVTLPGHLRVLFDKVYQGESGTGNAWVVWQRVLQARPQDPVFFRRLSAVQAACRTLRAEVSAVAPGAGSITDRMKTSWLGAIDQLTSLTVPGDFHLDVLRWKDKARPSDITLLDTMHVFYNLRGFAAEYDPDRVKSLAAELGELSEAIKTGQLDDRARASFIRALEELRFLLANLDCFGIEGAWTEGANLVAGLLRFRNELDANPPLRQQATTTVWQVLQFLGQMGGDGGVSVAGSARALLDAAPAA